MTNENDNIIDLTDSFTLVDHCDLENIVIEIDLNESTDSNSSVPSTKSWKRTVTTPKRKERLLSPKKVEKCKHRRNEFGHCPICWEDLGKNPLASTKCGHVYCMKCLELSLRKEKRCPTCRRVLKGVSAYHPLYIAQR